MVFNRLLITLDLLKMLKEKQSAPSCLSTDNSCVKLKNIY